MSSRRSFPGRRRSSNPFSTPRQFSLQHTLGRVIIAVIVIAAIYLVVDFAGRVWAEAYVAAQVEHALGLSGKPEVTFGGPLFVPQLLSGNLSSAKAKAEDFTSNNVAFLEVQLTMQDVMFSPGKLLFHEDATIVAHTGSGSATMTAEQLTEAFKAQGVPIEVRFTPEGDVRVAASRFPVAATVAATIENGDLVLHPTNPLFRKISFTLDLPEFVPGVTYTKIVFQGDQFQLSFDLNDAQFAVSGTG
jgi:hypothetical protein